MPAIYDPALVDVIPAQRPSARRGLKSALQRLIGMDREYRQMAALARLDDARLEDLGLSRSEVDAELERAGYRR